MNNNKLIQFIIVMFAILSSTHAFAERDSEEMNRVEEWYNALGCSGEAGGSVYAMSYMMTDPGKKLLCEMSPQLRMTICLALAGAPDLLTFVTMAPQVCNAIFGPFGAAAIKHCTDVWAAVAAVSELIKDTCRKFLGFK